MKHTVTEIVKNGNVATLDRVCNGNVYYRMSVDNTLYELELNSTDVDWKHTIMETSFKVINLMRWIRKSIEKNDDKFVQLN